MIKDAGLALYKKDKSFGGKVKKNKNSFENQLLFKNFSF